MSKTKSAFGRHAFSVRIVTDLPVTVERKNKRALTDLSWQLISLRSGPIWIKELPSGEIIISDEPQ